MATRLFAENPSAENIRKLAETAGEEMAKIFSEEKNLNEITCEIEIYSNRPLQYQIDYETLELMETIN